MLWIINGALSNQRQTNLASLMCKLTDQAVDYLVLFDTQADRSMEHNELSSVSNRSHSLLITRPRSCVHCPNRIAVCCWCFVRRKSLAMIMTWFACHRTVNIIHVIPLSCASPCIELTLFWSVASDRYSIGVLISSWVQWTWSWAILTC